MSLPVVSDWSAAPPEQAAAGSAVVLDATGSGFRRSVGPVAWMVLEELALASCADGSGRLVARLDVRGIARPLGLAKDTVARAMRRLIDAGVVRFDPGRQDGGRFGRGRYLLELETTGLAVAPHALPRPDRPDMVGEDAVVAAPRREGARRHQAEAASQLNLFDPNHKNQPQNDPSIDSTNDAPPVEPEKPNPANRDALAPRCPSGAAGGRERPVWRC